MSTIAPSRFVPGEFLTIREVAAALRLSPGTVYRKVEQGELEAVRIGRGVRPRLRIPSESVQQLVSPRETSG